MMRPSKDEDKNNTEVQHDQIDEKGRSKTKDQRYWKNERSIRRTFFNARGTMNAKTLAREAKVSRATLYRHHRSVYRIMLDIEEETLEEFSAEMRGMRTRKMQVPTMFYILIIYIRKHSEEFQAIVAYGDGRALEVMFEDLLPRIAKKYRIPIGETKATRIYQKELTGVIETWIMDGLSTSEMRVLKDMMYLTRTARKHLSPIGR